MFMAAKLVVGWRKGNMGVWGKLTDGDPLDFRVGVGDVEVVDDEHAVEGLDEEDQLQE